MSKKILPEPTEKNIAELKQVIDDKILKFNALVQDGGSFASANKLEDDIKEDINTYTAMCKEKCFIELRKSDDPMLAAVNTLHFNTIKTKRTKIEKSNLIMLELTDVEKPIDPLELDKTVKDGIGQDNKWMFMCERLNMLFTARVGAHIGDGTPEQNLKLMNDTYAMNKISRGITLYEKGDSGEMINPISDDNIITNMQYVVNAMIGEEYIVTKKDLAFIDKIYTKKGKKALTVSCANHRNFRGYMMEVCYNTIHHLGYDLDYKLIKER